jgi:hypothetical protein
LLFVMQDLFIVIVGGSTRVVVPMDRPRSWSIRSSSLAKTESSRASLEPSRGQRRRRQYLDSITRWVTCPAYFVLLYLLVRRGAERTTEFNPLSFNPISIRVFASPPNEQTKKIQRSDFWFANAPNVFQQMAHDFFIASTGSCRILQVTFLSEVVAAQKMRLMFAGINFKQIARNISSVWSLATDDHDDRVTRRLRGGASRANRAPFWARNTAC